MCHFVLPARDGFIIPCGTQMLREVQQMHDAVLEYKVDVAISSNRLTRLDNPIVHDKLRSLKKQAELVFQSSAEA